MLDQEEVPIVAIQGSQPIPSVIAILDTIAITTDAADLEVRAEYATEIALVDVAPIILAPTHRSSCILGPSTLLSDFSTYHTTQHPI
ncbi:hypothetical protein EUGRSUZ_L00965 [Eucalyptus grandis]|uniref:Uncharacterized protein n=1 Tax=Eucalyptus grandis TaxID=71139 RepID=A0A058ZU68_EUCGR|nr:hypothetical protein EUGRSUZ_L00965 [Eucalyptus grandis]